MTQVHNPYETLASKDLDFILQIWEPSPHAGFAMISNWSGELDDPTARKNFVFEPGICEVSFLVWASPIRRGWCLAAEADWECRQPCGPVTDALSGWM